MTVADAPAVLHQASTAQAWCDIVNGNIDERVRTASITFGKAPHVALAAGGPGLRQPGAARPVRPPVRGGPRVRRRRRLRLPRHRDHLRRHRARAAQHRLARPGRRVAEPGGRPAVRRAGARRLPVPDPRARATWPGSATRPTTPDDPPIGETVADGKVELFIGEPVDWLPIYDARDADARAGLGAARRRSSPTTAQVAELLGDRPEPAAERRADRRRPSRRGAWRPAR